MKQLAGSMLFLALTLSVGTADATTMVFVHGRNAGTPTTTEACDYWGGCTCSVSSNSGGYSNSGWCGFAGGSAGTYSRYVARYDATLAWWGDGATNEPICDVAAEINALSDTNIHVVGHSAGGLVTLGLLTDAANGWGSACGAGVVAGAANKITAVAAVQSPFSGARAADSVYGHLASSDWLHNICGNTVGALANIFADQASDMTYALQTSVMANNRGWVTNSTGKPVYIAFGTSTGGDDSGWLGAGSVCTGGSYNDGLVEAWSARACTNNTSGKTGSCTSKTTNFTDYAYAAIGHSSGRRGTSATSDMWYSGMTSAHAHGMSDLVWNHSPI